MVDVKWSSLFRNQKGAKKGRFGPTKEVRRIKKPLNFHFNFLNQGQLGFIGRVKEEDRIRKGLYWEGIGVFLNWKAKGGFFFQGKPRELFWIG